MLQYFARRLLRAGRHELLRAFKAVGSGGRLSSCTPYWVIGIVVVVGYTFFDLWLHPPLGVAHSFYYGFESYLRGSWWDVQIRQERSSMFLVSYNADKDEEWAWVPLTELRLGSRRGDGWDCFLLKKGMYVSVLSKHPNSSSLNLEKEGLYDARISSVARSDHAPGKCTCKFSILFLSVKMNTYTDGSLLDRVLLMDEPETQVSVSDIRILQKPAEIIPLQDVLDAHRSGMWIPLGRGCQDAYFLTETELSTAKRPRGVPLDNIGLTHVRSDEVLSPSAARVSTKNGEKGSNCDSPVDGPQVEALGSQQSPGTPQVEYRIPKSTCGAAENQKQKQSGGTGGYADGASPESINIKRKCASAEGHDDGHSNGSVDEGASRKKRGRPRLDKSFKGVHIIEDDKICDNAHALNKEVRSRHKEKTKYTVKEDRVEKDVLPGLKKDLASRHKEKTKYTVKKENVDLKWTENLNVSSGDESYSESERKHTVRPQSCPTQPDSDSEGEWKPSVGMKNFRSSPYNIRTRDRTVPHKPKSEEKKVTTGKHGGTLLRRTHRNSNRAPCGKATLDKEAKRDYLAYASGSRDVHSSGSG